MEFLRFGSSIPGGCWGCCACCIIQDFNQSPDEKASIQLVSGDGGGAITRGKGALFAGPTYRDIFNQRIRSGTFDSRDMPNHAFIAIITANQCNGSVGQAWLKILKETGFEFIRGVANSVYTGAELGTPASAGSSMNYIFGLFRNIGSGSSADQFMPPKAWQDLPNVKPEAWALIPNTGKLTLDQHAVDTEIWNKIGSPKFLSEEEVLAAGAVVTMAGIRSEFPPEQKLQREQKKAALLERQGTGAKPNAFVTPIALQNLDEAEEDIEPEYDDDYDNEDDDYECIIPGCCGNPE